MTATISLHKFNKIFKNWQSLKKHPASFLVRILVWLSAIVTIGIMLMLAGYVLIKGVAHLKPSLFAWTYTSDNCSMTPALINTVLMTFLTLLIAVPIGVFSAIYMVEYARRGNPFVKVVRTTTETLSGIPSIVYGLFGYLIFVVALKFHLSMLSGALTLAIMVLPTIMRTTEEALLSVPDAYREGSFGLGAGRLRTVFKVVLPEALPGILSGVILSIGRIVGETAALIYTAGTVPGIPKTVMASGRTLSIHMYSLLSEGLHTEEAYATAVVLLVLVLLINGLSELIARRISGKDRLK